MKITDCSEGAKYGSVYSGYKGIVPNELDFDVFMCCSKRGITFVNYELKINKAL